MKNLQGKRAILYRRVSTAEQRKVGQSLDYQRDSLHRFCNSHGLEIVREFQEDYSAKNFEDRSVYQELERFAQMHRHQIDFLLLTKIDRFSRNMAQTIAKVEQFRRWGIEVNFIEEWFNWSDPGAFITQVIHMALPENENLIKASRTKAGMHQALKEGRYVGRQPIGYVPGKDEVGKPLMQLDVAKAPLVRQLFNLYATGIFSQNQLLKDSRFASLNLTKSSLSRLLSIHFIAVELCPRFNIVKTVLGLHEAIVTPQIFEKVQKIRGIKQNAAPKTQKRNPELPLRGHLKYPSCGRNLTGSGSRGKSGKRHFYYHCEKRYGCDYRGRRNEHHKAFEDLVKVIQPTTGVVTLFEAVLRDVFNSKHNSIEQNLRGAETRLKTLENKREILLEKLLEGVVSNGHYKSGSARLDNQIEEVKSEIDQLKQTDSGIEDFIPFGISLTQTSMACSIQPPSRSTSTLSSILAEKLELKGIYRTPVFKEGFDPTG